MSAFFASLSKILPFLFLGMVLVFSFSFALWNKYPTSGDESHYVLIAQSLWQDRDVALSNNYAQKDYQEYFPEAYLNPHAVAGVDGELRSWHQFLISLMVLPGYVLRGLLGARLFMWLLNLAGLGLLWGFLRSLGFAFAVRSITTALYASQLIVVTYAQYVYTDLVNGYAVLAVLVTLYQYHRYRDWRWLIGSSFVGGLAIFLHVKLLLFTPIIYVLYLGYLLSIEPARSWGAKLKSVWRQRGKDMLIAAGPFVALVLLCSVVMYRWTGIFRPDALMILALEEVYHVHFETFFVYTPQHILTGFLGLWWDSENGLLATSPFFILAWPGFALLRGRYPRLAYWILGGFLLLLLRQCTFINWRTWGPPARYMTVFTPSLAVMAAYYVDVLYRSWSGRIGLGLLGAWSVLVSSSLFFVGLSGYPTLAGSSVYLDWALEQLSLGHVSPVLTLNFDAAFRTSEDYMQGILWTIGLCIWSIGVGLYCRIRNHK